MANDERSEYQAAVTQAAWERAKELSVTKGMNIRKELGELVILQTFVILPKEDSPEVKKLHREADEKAKKIIAYVEHLEEGLQLIVNTPDTLGFTYAMAQVMAALVLRGPKEEGP